MAYDPNAPGNNPGGMPPPNTPYGPTNYGAPPPPPPGPSDPYQSQQPYNPYAPSTPSYPPVPNPNSSPAYPSQPGISGAGYNDPTYVSPSAQGYQAPPVQPGPSYPGYPPVNQGYPQQGFVPPPQKKGSSGGKIALIILAVVVVLAGIGIFSASAYNTSQSNAHATATAQAQDAKATANVQATATYMASHFPFSSKLILNDSLSGNNPAHGWMSDKYCSFSNSMYHASETKTSTFVTCSAKSTNYTDFSFEATMQNFIGNAGGLVFRGDEDQQNYYLFLVFYDGSFGFYSYSTSSHTKKIIIGNVDNFSITKPIRLGVTAQGNSFKFFADGQPIGQATDSTYSHGQVGVAVDNDALITEANFSNAKVWQL